MEKIDGEFAAVYMATIGVHCQQSQCQEAQDTGVSTTGKHYAPFEPIDGRLVISHEYFTRCKNTV